MAAVEAQRALAAEPWPAGVEVNVRMGLHAGEASESAAGLVGLDINRAARIAAAAHGGQVVVSDAVRTLVTADLGAGVSLRGLGRHRLKDLREPEPLCQVVADGLRMEFPPLRSLDARPNNLPTQLTSFVGRERELAEAGRAPGGEPPRDPDRARRHRQDATVPAGRRERRRSTTRMGSSSSRSRRSASRRSSRLASRPRSASPSPAHRTADAVLREWLADKQVLLVLDNFEQVVDAGAVIAEPAPRRPGPVRDRDLARPAPRLRRAGVPGPGPAHAA